MKRGPILTKNSISNDEEPVKENTGYGIALVSNGSGLGVIELNLPPHPLHTTETQGMGCPANGEFSVISLSLNGVIHLIEITL